MADLDAFSMRLELGVVLLSSLVLCYGATYRSTRARYVGLWCLALVVFATSSLLSLGNGTAAQAWTQPAAGATMALGATLVWRAARTLDGRTLPWAVHAALPGLVLVASGVASSGTDEWAGAWAMFVAVVVAFAGATVAMWCPHRTETGRLRRATAASGVVVAVYYLARLVGLLVLGPDHGLFRELFGFQVTTVVLTVLLEAATFSMSALTYEQERSLLRQQASTDGLTGLLNRAGFLDRARALRRDAARADVGCVLAIADLDHFKHVNDRFGHAVGDAVLVAFPDACRASVRALDVVGRQGGEEFVFLLAGAEPDGALRAFREIDGRLAVLCGERGLPATTVSYGLVAVREGVAFADLLREADRALYEAKARGRHLAVVA